MMQVSKTGVTVHFDVSRRLDPHEMIRAVERAASYAALGIYPMRYMVGVGDVVTGPPRKGDKIRTTISGYVHKVNDDGTIVLKHSPGAYDLDGAITIDRRDPADVTVLERAPAEPMVGDTITGAQVVATPWRRGTTLADGVGRRYVLTGTGQWVSLDYGYTFGFDAFANLVGDTFRVIDAPGKETRAA